MSEISESGFHDPKDGVSVNVLREKGDQMYPGQRKLSEHGL